MVLYQTTRCPCCGHVLEEKQTGINDLTEYFGDPLRRCPKCRTQYKTGKKYWKDMGPFERAWIYLMAGVGHVYSTFFYSTMATLLFAGIFQYLNLSSDSFLTLVLGWWTILFILLLVFFGYRTITQLHSFLQFGDRRSIKVNVLCPHCVQSKEILQDALMPTMLCPGCGKEFEMQCPRGHGELRAWEGRLRCWTCGWPES